MFTVFYNHITEAMKQEGMSLNEVAKVANEHGIYGVEIDYRDLNPTGKRFNKELAGELSKAGIPIYGVYVFFDWANHPFDTGYKRIYREISEIGVKKSLAIPGMYSDKISEEKSKKRMVRCLKKAVEVANSYGIEVLLEDFDDKVAPFSTADGMEYFFERIPKLKCAFDTGNFYYSDEDALEVLPRFINNVTYVHCKDRSLTKNEKEIPKATVSGVDMYSAAVGKGVIPIDKIVNILVSNGYKGDYAIEHFGSLNHLRDMTESADYLKTIVCK